MVLSYVLVWVLAANWCFHWINYWLPEYVVEQNFWLIDMLYRLLNIIAPICFMYTMVTFDWHWPTILMGSFLYLCAFIIKKIARHLAYKDYLQWYE